MIIDEDLDKLLENLPFFIEENLNNNFNKEKLIEIVIDLGRRPEARFTTGPEYLSQKIVSWQDLDYTIKRISNFNNDNRVGLERTLHRISCIRNRQSLINGLTCRVGRAIFGAINIIRDLLESEQSILILGKPGIGKTTIIREIARVLSDEMEKIVVVIDTSNEIAGGVYILRDIATKVNVPDNTIDTCGTGGDGKNTLNISTAAALLLSSFGVKVAKHGNKSVS